ncbi:MAG: restriction endonuclease subunit S [Alistipes senegalensis]|nr:restriction endonuclease subunit S [Alistipes senegalensis]
MNRLKNLINELCPDGVEYVKIGDVVNYEQPAKYIVKSTDYSDKFDIPVLTAGQTFILGYTDEKNNIYRATKENPVIIFDDFTGAFKWVDFPFKVKSSAMKILTADEDKTFIRYIFHIMGKIGFSSDEHKRLWISIYSEFKIPLPPLDVQREIVRILDTFTEYTGLHNILLERELELRKKQYQYYRNKLLTFGNDVEYKKIKEIYKRLKGTPITAGKMKEIEDKNGKIKIFAGGKTVINANESNIPQANIIKVPALLVQSRGIIDVIFYDKPFTF